MDLRAKLGLKSHEGANSPCSARGREVAGNRSEGDNVIDGGACKGEGHWLVRGFSERVQFVS